LLASADKISSNKTFAFRLLQYEAAHRVLEIF